ncbi:MAG TPA: DHHA1 domain-containing protein, partial [Solirubrobacterales bacterium]|nr:DHHA1 domain-containing protein [Solirubrobacterales bacterium]
GQRVGIRVLAEAAGCSLDQLDEGDLSMRLGPRINAAGRLYRADAGVELLLTEDVARATEIAEELNRANRQRQTTERKASGEAEACYRELSEQLREAPAAVLAGEGWHPGVIGIVASRFVERHYKPTVVIAIDEEGNARGSGRSIPGFDLLAALEACSEHLLSFGGHRGAAGLTLATESIDLFREAFAAHAETVLDKDGLRRTERIDAMVGGASLGLDLAEELGRLAPFGMGNPGVRLLVPSAHVRNVQPMGKGKHSRFSLHSGAHRAVGVAFGKPTLGVGDDESLDAAVRLEVNQWNGSVEPRVVLRELYPLGEGVEDASPPLHLCECGEGEWWQRFEAELAYDLERTPAPLGPSAWRMERDEVRGDGSAASVIAELLSSGSGVLAVCSDASRRAALAMGSAGLARFNGGTGQVACGRCGGAVVEGLVKRAAGGFALTDYHALESAPALAAEFSHVVLVDPPASAREHRLAANGFGFLHPVWTEAERGFALSVLGERYPQRGAIKAQFEALREA